MKPRKKVSPKIKGHILFLAAENDGIVGCKTGGIGDVVRDTAPEIGKKGFNVTVITPAYGRLHLNGKKIGEIEFDYYGQQQKGELFEVEGKEKNPNIRHLVLHNELITKGNLGGMYHDDGENLPFFTDAIKFTVFCTAIGKLICENKIEKPDCIHLHDWHSAFLLVLRKYHSEFSALKKIRTVFTIHNIEYQGIRPFKGDASSLSTWFPNLDYDERQLIDPKYANCLNLMAIGIRLSDAIHVVSPSYSKEVLLPSKRPEFVGGEGLENDLVQAEKENRLHGILNGTTYNGTIPRIDFASLVNVLIPETLKWIEKTNDLDKAKFHANQCLKLLKRLENKPSILLTSVSRLVRQKFYFWEYDKASLEKILGALKEKDGLFILLGSGLNIYEELFREISDRFENFVFLNGYSDKSAKALYASGNLFMMPSSFEPCGISQMLAMKNGQPCLVHSIGGLIDTVNHKKTGFCFSGNTMEDKSNNMVEVFEEAVELFFHSPKIYAQISSAAATERFLWENSVEKYLSQLYNL